MDAGYCRYIEGVVHPGALALHTHTSPHRLGNTEEHQGLVHQVRSQIEEHASAGSTVLPPGVQPGQLAKAVVVGFEHHQPAQPIAVEQFAHRQKVTIPSPVLVNAEQSPTRPGQLDQLRCLGRKSGQTAYR